MARLQVLVDLLADLGHTVESAKAANIGFLCSCCGSAAIVSPDATHSYEQQVAVIGRIYDMSCCGQPMLQLTAVNQ